MSVKAKVVLLLLVLCGIFACTCNAEDVPTISLIALPSAFNPASSDMALRYSTVHLSAENVKVQITDGKGGIIRAFDAGKQPAGTYNITWDGKAAGGQPAPDGDYKAIAIASAGTVVLPQHLLKLEPGILTDDLWLCYCAGSPAVDERGNIYVTEGREDCVRVFDPHGGFLLRWGSTGNGNGQFRCPSGIAADRAGNIYVVDTLNCRVQKFDRSGKYLLQWGGCGAGDGRFSYPSGVALDAEGNVYVVDTWNNRVQVFDGSGRFLRRWGTRGSGEAQFEAPRGIAIDNDGHIYVADTYNDRILKFTRGGAYAGEWADSDSRPLTLPVGISITGEGNVQVVDGGNRRVQEIRPDGTLVGQTYAPSGHVEAASSMAPGPAFTIGNGYIGRWMPASGGPEGLVYLSERCCERIVKLSPFTKGDPAIFSATAGIIVDRKPPEINISSPTDGASFARNVKVAAAWTASDSLSGLKAAKGTVPTGSYIDTSRPGINEYSVQATDSAGNVRTLTHRYFVIDDSPPPVSSPPPIEPPGLGATPTPTPSGRQVGAIVTLAGSGGRQTAIKAEVAQTSEQISRGLMYRTSLPGDQGMLFIFSGDGYHTFSMTNTYIPLDIIFIASDLTIVNIHANARPLDTSPIPSGARCHYVLEVNGGTCAANGIVNGNKVKIDWL